MYGRWLTIIMNSPKNWDLKDRNYRQINQRISVVTKRHTYMVFTTFKMCIIRVTWTLSRTVKCAKMVKNLIPHFSITAILCPFRLKKEKKWNSQKCIPPCASTLTALWQYRTAYCFTWTFCFLNLNLLKQFSFRT